MKLPYSYDCRIACLTVVLPEDTIKGMPKHRRTLERIFDALYTTKPGGMGMGLSISRTIVENHGGRLSVVAHDGPGATFEFTLPTHS